MPLPCLDMVVHLLKQLSSFLWFSSKCSNSIKTSFLTSLKMAFCLWTVPTLGFGIWDMVFILVIYCYITYYLNICSLTQEMFIMSHSAEGRESGSRSVVWFCLRGSWSQAVSQGWVSKWLTKLNGGFSSKLTHRALAGRFSSTATGYLHRLLTTRLPQSMWRGRETDQPHCLVWPSPQVTHHHLHFILFMRDVASSSPCLWDGACRGSEY